MALAEALGIALIGVPVYDWMMVTGAAARMTSFDYRYWPMSKARIVTIVLLAVGAFVTFLIMQPPEPDGRLWVLLPAAIGLVAHTIVVIIDLLAQRQRAAATA